MSSDWKFASVSLLILCCVSAQVRAYDGDMSEFGIPVESPPIPEPTKTPPSGAGVADPVGEIYFREDFEGETVNFGARGWFGYAGGTGGRFEIISAKGAGSHHSQGLLFRFTGTNANGKSSYWFAGLGRNAIVIPEGARPGDFMFSAYLAMPGEKAARQVPIRFIQGDPEKPTWSVRHSVRVDPNGGVVRFRLDDGEQSGTYSEMAPINLHSISFRNEQFGFNKEFELIIDSVRVVKDR